MGRRAGRSSCLAEAAVTPSTPAWAGGWPGEQVAEGEPSGPEQIGLTLPTPPPSSLPRLPPRDATGPRRWGLPGSAVETRPGPACRLAG